MEEKIYDPEENVLLTRDVGEVGQEVVRLRSIVESLDRNYSIISELLAPVLRPYSENAEKDTRPTPVLVPLADSLHEINDDLSNIHRRFTELGDRISL